MKETCHIAAVTQDSTIETHSIFFLAQNTYTSSTYESTSDCAQRHTKTAVRLKLLMLTPFPRTVGQSKDGMATAGRLCHSVPHHFSQLFNLVLGNPETRAVMDTQNSSRRTYTSNAAAAAYYRHWNICTCGR